MAPTCTRARSSARRFAKRPIAAAGVVLLPTIPYGTETNMHRFPLAMSVDPMTLYGFITDIVKSCIHSGVRKIVSSIAMAATK